MPDQRLASGQSVARVAQWPVGLSDRLADEVRRRRSDDVAQMGRPIQQYWRWGRQASSAPNQRYAAGGARSSSLGSVGGGRG
eukprot:10391685-Alexandrium_andersonii.AAC.1